MVAEAHVLHQERPGLIGLLNTKYHERALWVFAAIVVAHWAEHLVQAYQIWIDGRARPDSRGVLGQILPSLVSGEWLHFGYAVVMLIGLVLLLPGMTGRARTFWLIALGIQAWHLLEHTFLFIQAQTHDYWFGGAVPTSVLQAVWPARRVEIHLFYNAMVTIPMIVAMYFHMWPPLQERGRIRTCSCDRTARRSTA